MRDNFGRKIMTSVKRAAKCCDDFYKDSLPI